MCDIDRFKAINDRFGHEFGDRVLVQITDILRSFANENRMLVARHGGEEFTILMVGITNEQAAQYAEDIRRACAAKEVMSADLSVRVTISIGLTVSRNETDLRKSCASPIRRSISPNIADGTAWRARTSCLFPSPPEYDCEVPL
jgi:diguanylate cyclase (GGDEF)-like protein